MMKISIQSKWSLSQVVLAIWLVSYLMIQSEAAKVKRVKAGMKYKKDDPVHVVVNKIG